MASRSTRTGQGAPPSSNRQNEYFVPRDGIDREVITADICRYLGNDALVRPGVYESPQTGQVVQGYYITAYRNLTTAMIEDLKADSARWDQERRQQTSRNTVGVQYRNSDTHQSRQYYGPTEASGGPQIQDNTRDSYDGSIRYPGTGNAGYTGASGGGYPNQPYGTQGGYGGQPGYANAPAPQFSQAPADPYAGNPPMAGQGFGQQQTERPYAQAVNFPVRPGSDTPMYGAGDSYASGSGDRLTASSSASGRPTYVTSGAPAQPGYAPTSGSGFYPQNPGPSSSSSQFAVQPNDVFFGRGNPSSHEHQYETTPPPRTSASTSNTQMATSGSSSRRDNRDSGDRSHGDARQRHHRR